MHSRADVHLSTARVSQLARPPNNCAISDGGLVRSVFAALGGVVFMGCAETPVIAPLGSAPRPVIVVGTETFYVKGASYGPTWDEISDSGCGTVLREQTADSATWVYSTGDTTKVYSSKYDPAPYPYGCAIGTESDGGANYVGGTADIVATRPAVCPNCVFGVQVVHPAFWR